MSTHFHKSLKILRSIQTIKMNKDIITIGINKQFITKFDKYKDYFDSIKLFKPTFSTFLEPKQVVNSYEIIGSLYDNILMNQYLFYTPSQGEIIYRNESLLQNIDKIYDNHIDDNWLVKIKIDDPNKSYSSYY